MAVWDAVGIYDANKNLTECGFPKHINTTTTNTAADAIFVQTGPAFLWRLISNQTGSADWVVAIYDAAQASDIVAANLIGICDANNGGNYEYGVATTRGIAILTYFTSSGNQAGDVTVVSVGV